MIYRTWHLIADDMRCAMHMRPLCKCEIVRRPTDSGGMSFIFIDDDSEERVHRSSMGSLIRWGVIELVDGVFKLTDSFFKDGWRCGAKSTPLLAGE